MVEPTQACLGLDRRGSVYYAARIESTTGRYEVKALARFEQDHIADHKLLDNARIVLAVDESKAMIKRLRLSGENSSQIESNAKFEMSQTVFGDDSEFAFETIPTGLNTLHLGTIVRLSSVNSDFLNQSKPSYRVRSVAIAKAFAAFCQKNNGQLTALLDFVPGYVSVAFVYHDHLIGIESLNLGLFDLENESHFNKVAVELKTLINFSLASLFNDGLTIPLAQLYVSGQAFSEEQILSFKNQIGVDISYPMINTGYFPDPAALENIPLDQYLVALGLAVN